MKESNIKLFNYCHYIFFFLVFLIGIYIYKDFGFNIDESFQRRSGFYWLNYLVQLLNLEHLSTITEQKFLSSYEFTIPWSEKDKAYGILFDVPAAFLEIIFKVNEPIEYYQLRHLLTFFYFFIGLIFFYKLLFIRFQSRYLSLFGCLLLFITPRIFGESFHNNKDIVFLSFFIITLFFYFKVIEREKLSNILFFSLFSAIASSTRIFGFIFPISFVFLFLLSILSQKKDLKKFKQVLVYLFFFLFFLILLWPFLWSNPIQNLLIHFNNLGDFGPPIVFFNNSFYDTHLVPYYYLPLWIFISTPIFNILLFISGLFFSIKIFIKKLFKVEENKIGYDFWDNANEKKDFLILIIFTIFFLGGTFLNINHYNSWRVFYFLNFFIIYFSISFVHVCFTEKKFKKYTKIFLTLILVAVLFNISKLYIYHPYQSFYFSSILPSKFKDNFEVDYTGLSGIEFLRETVKLNNENKIMVGINSWYPLWRMKNLLPIQDRKRIEFVYDDINSADIVYSNRIYNVNINKSKKYNLKDNFKIYKRHIIDQSIIYEIYIKN